MEQQRRQAGLLFEKAATGIENTEKLLESFYPNVHRIMQERKQRQQAKQQSADEEQKLSAMWQKTKQQALARHDEHCPICFNLFVSYKETALLDCSHMFHANCLLNFEKYDREAHEENQGAHSCPMCRHPKY